jgi:hypothetical protein
METVIFASVLLIVPLIPTLVVYKVIRDKRTRARAAGTLFGGIQFETGGAFAAYVISVGLVAFLYNQVNGSELRNVRLVVHAKGEPQRLRDFSAGAAAKAEVLLVAEGGGTPIRVPYLEVNADRNQATGDVRIPAADIGKRFSIRLLYAGEPIPLSPSEIRLTDNVEVTADFGESERQRQWQASLDAYSTTVKNSLQDLYFRELQILYHDSKTPLESLPLHGYLSVGRIVYLQVGARLVDRETAGALAAAWSTVPSTAAEYANLFERRFEEYKTLGDEIGVRHFTNDELVLEGQGQRFSRGSTIGLDAQRMIPTIGPIPGGVPSNKAVIVYVDSWRRTDADFQRKGHDITIGDTFQRFTQKVLFGLAVPQGEVLDATTIRAEFKEDLLNPIPMPSTASLHKDASNVILTLRDAKPGDVVQLHWAWK